VVVDETRVRRVNVKVAGFVEKIFVDYVGKRVRRGDPLFALFSPELVAAEDEYLLALRSGATAAGAGSDGARDAFAQAARRKLSLWDVSDAELERLERTRQAERTLTFASPVSGVVTRKDIVQGARVEVGATPYEIVDLSRVWLLADVYERELAFAKEGLPATLTLNAFPGREFVGKVSFVDPLLDPASRTVKLRIGFANPSGELRPEMFGEVVLQGTPREGVTTIPADAVIDSGTGQIVFVASGDGRFSPRRVRLGTSEASRVEVVEGLAVGERVVTRANFLIDSESRLRASLGGLAPPAVSAAKTSARVLPGSDAPASGGSR
jgi:Cu(I)/Ag(I) efflux system membrane fusion protein